MLAINPTTVNAGPLRIAGTAEITVDGKAFNYQTVQVKASGTPFRSATYIENPNNDEYSIAIGAYENPQPSEDLDKLIPMIDGPLITVSAFITSNGQETRGAEITW